MKAFMDKDFLLSTDTAKKLFHEIAEPMPVLDYHCHINPREIAEDRKFENITQVWLGGDHYKWRQMRSNGVDEYYITGEAPDREKFQKWAETLELAVGNPLYHWSHLELQRFFGYHGILNGETAELSVEDNGLGMTPEELNRLRENINGDVIKESAHIGLSNVNQRIRLYYGNEYGLIIDSREGIGTRVTIRFPRLQPSDPAASN